MSRFEDYFSKDYLDLKQPGNIPIEKLAEEAKIFISGDFYGIQKFIFEGLTTKNASKVLRAKSAYVQIITQVVAKYVCVMLHINPVNIITTNAGKFEILSSVDNAELLQKAQDQIDQFFIQTFYGLSGINISSVTCSQNDFASPNAYKNLRQKIANALEIKKYRKFNLSKQHAVLTYDTNITNQSLCRICNMRKIKDEHCAQCSMFVTLGKWLVSDKKSVNSKNDLLINLGDFSTDIVLDKKIKSYVLKDAHDAPETFEKLAEKSCEDHEGGIQALGVLKADVDGMGNFIRNSSVTHSFENFDLFSKTLDAFFSEYIPKKMKDAYSNSYIVFAGGDDLFLVGSWDVILKLARWVEEAFKKFVVSKELTISFGIAIAKPATPISYLADHTEHLLELAKAMDGKDALALFGEVAKWSTYKRVYTRLDDAFQSINHQALQTAFLYRLLDFCEMSKEVKNGDIKATIWKSKLRYSFYRNNAQLGENFVGLLNESIDNNPQETKMFLCEFIYKRRD